MNERIRQLAEQAREYVADAIELGFPQDQVDDIRDEKFAELIVAECVQTLRDNTPVVDEHDSVEDWDRGYIRAMADCEHHIQEHFGIER